MNKALRLMVLMLLVGPWAWAVEGREVALHGGTVKEVPIGAVGTLDLSSASQMVFAAGGKEIVVPYTRVKTVAYTSEVARHLGVLPAIAVGLVRKRERRHMITVTFEDGDVGMQVMVLEVSKGMPGEVLATFLARAPQACGKDGFRCRRPVQY